MSVNVKKRVHVSFFFRLLRNVKKNFFSRYKILDNVKRIRFGLICGLTIILIFFCFYLVNPFFNGDAVFSSYGFFFFGIVFCIFVYYGTKRKCFESFDFDFKNDFFFFVGETTSKNDEEPKTRVTREEYSYETPDHEPIDILDIDSEDEKSYRRRSIKSVTSRSSTTDSVKDRFR